MRDDSRTGARSKARGGVSRAADPARPQAARPQAARPQAAAEAQAPGRTDEALRLVHHHPGYLRVRAAVFLQPREDDPVVAAARAAAEGVAGFRSWSLNPVTGSVVIQYEPGAIEADDLLKHIAQRAGFSGVEITTHGKSNRRELVGTFLDGVQDINRAMGELTSERADLRELVPLALVAVSVVSFVVNDERGRLPHWFSALYRSYRIFMQWHRREVRTRERASRQAEELGAVDQPGGGME